MSASPFFWRCWRCGGQHPTFEQRCPNSGPNYEGAPSRAAMLARWEAFKARYMANTTSGRRAKLQAE